MRMSELAELLRCGRREMTAILKDLDFVQIEESGRYSRYRLSNWVIAKGWGRRLRCKGSKYPFDVVSPDAAFWLIDRWEQAKSDYHDRTHNADVVAAKQALQRFQDDRGRWQMSVQEMVSWLADHLPGLSQEKIAAVLDVTQQVVSKFLNRRSKQRAMFKALRRDCPERRKIPAAIGLQYEGHVGST